MRPRVVVPLFVLVVAGVIAWIYWPGYKPTWLGGPEPLPSPTELTYAVHFDKAGHRFSSISAQIEQGAEYQFNTGHCGLDYLTDFDGSFWIPEDVPGDGPLYYYNEDEGTMTLISEDEALYLSSDSQKTTLTRHEGPITLKETCQ